MKREKLKGIIGVLTFFDSEVKGLGEQQDEPLTSLEVRDRLVLIFRELKAMKRVCGKLYFLIDKSICVNVQKINEFCGFHDIVFIQMPKLSEYSALCYVNSNSLKEDLICYKDSKFITDDVIDYNSLLNTVYYELERNNTFLFTSTLHAESTCTNFDEFEFSIKSIRFTENNHLGFISDSGCLLNWTGMLFFKNYLYQDLNSSYNIDLGSFEPYWIESKKFGYKFPISFDALDLTNILCTSLIAPFPFRVLIQESSMFNSNSINFATCYDKY